MKYQVMPDLTPVEYEALKADIAQNGVLVPIEVDEDGNTLDGHHRIRAWEELKAEGRQLPDYPFILRPGLTEGQKRNHARRLNIQRRHLTSEQKAKIAEDLVRDRDAEKSTREAITEAAELTGLSQRRVEQVTSDIRQEEKEQRNQRIQELSDLGWSQRDIADEIGVSVGTVNELVQKSKNFDFRTPLPGIIGTGEDGMRKAAKLTDYANGGGIVTVDSAEDARIEEERAKRVQREVEQNSRPHVANNSGNNEWYTPEQFTQAARDVMGEITLDPASSELANTKVRAAHIYTADDDGLSMPWFGKVWLNPPYAAGLVDKFASKLVEEYESGEVDEAIVLVNNATETGWFASLVSIASVVCFPSQRVRFWSPSGEPGAPLQGQAIVYVGNDAGKFVDRFSDVGWCAWVA